MNDTQDLTHRIKPDGIERSYPADAASWSGDGRLLPISVEAIQHWLRGIPKPADAVDTLVTNDGAPSELVQSGDSTD